MDEAVSCPQVGLPKVGLHLVPQTELPEGRVMSVFPSLVSPGQVSAPTRSLGPVRARLCLPCSQAPLGHCHTSTPRPLRRELSKGQAVSPLRLGNPLQGELFLPTRSGQPAPFCGSPTPHMDSDPTALAPLLRPGLLTFCLQLPHGAD